jgi:hypothetical protein
MGTVVAQAAVVPSIIAIKARREKVVEIVILGSHSIANHAPQ